LSHNSHLLLCAFLGVLGLVVLVARFKFHSFVALILASIFVGLCSGMSPAQVAKSVQDGVGAILASIALIVGFGALLGKMLAESGGAEVVATTLLQRFGKEKMHWTLLWIGLLVGIPVFFGVGVVLLVPILFTLIRQTQRPTLLLGIPLLAGLSVAHGLVPPHPGPIAAIGLLQATVGPTDVGRTILYSLLIGIPTAAIAGPLFAKVICRKVVVQVPLNVAIEVGERRNRPTFSVTTFTILLPVLLMLLASLADVTCETRHPFRIWADFLGHPAVALLAGFLLSLYTFGFAMGSNGDQILKWLGESLRPVAEILLVVGAGGAFNRVLIEGGVGGAIADSVKGWNLSPYLLGWTAAALIRVATGSATVAITTAAGLIAPLVVQTPGLNRELLVIAMGAGSLILSHLNDGGFWFVKEYFQMSVPQMLKTWTIMETIISVVALALVFVLDWVLRLM
jgi:gluconate:H+ symporter, GntP family